jgi:hypothetical protein
MKTKVVREWDFEQKNIAREIALGAIKKMSKVAIFFPSDTCMDLRLALKLHRISLTTFLIIVERNPEVVKEIKKYLKKVGFKNYIIHDHYAGVHKLDLKSVLKGKKVDFMFFDLCGNLKAEIWYWLQQNQDNFTNDASIPMTFALHPRGARAKTRGRKKDTGRLTSFYFAVNKITDDFSYETSVFGKKDNLASCGDESSFLLRDFRLTCKAITHAFSKRNICIKETYIYRSEDADKKKQSRTNMGMFNIRINGTKEEDLTYKKIISEYDKKVSKGKMLIKARKQRTCKNRKNVLKEGDPKTAYEIARSLDLFGNFKSIIEIPRGKKAHITIKAKKAGLDPQKVMDKIERKLQKI